MELYVLDDAANEDIELGVHRWLVTSDEEGDDTDMEVARFKNETDAEKFVAMMTEK